MKSTNINLGGLLPSGLTILFIWMKLTEQIDWSWWWVLSPLWIGLVIVLGILSLLTLGVFLVALFK